MTRGRSPTPRGVTTTYAYNLRDQVTGMTYSDGTPAVTMSYDAAGRPLEIGNAVATDAYAYDDAGQLAVETQSVAGHPAAMRTLTHSHDADGLRTGLVYPGGKVLAAGYTARGQLATMTFHGQPVATSTYRPNGQPIGTVYGNGAQRTLSYDAAGRLTGTGTNVGAATITGRGYALDAVGRRTGYVDETAANAVFSYDPAGQVLGGTVPVPGQPASVNTYTYDPEGNRTQSSTGIQPAPADPVTITGSTTYTANPLNQYTAITGNPAPTYDADGNLLSGLRSPLSGFTCTWNGENRMLSSTSANVAITDRRVENAYDALGRRVRKTVKFASTGAVIEDRYFIYDGWNVIEETIAPATGPVETAEHVWGADLSGTAQGAGGVGGLLLRESSATGASYYHYDGNGNVTALTSGAGTVQAAYTYGPFGETLRAAGPLAQANPWRFSTKYQDDETGLLYYGYRFYNPTDGRWPSRDPIGEEGGLNLFMWVSNNPVNSIDVIGLSIFALLEVQDGYWDKIKVAHDTAKAEARKYINSPGANNKPNGYFVRYFGLDGNEVSKEYPDAASWLKAVEGDTMKFNYSAGKKYDADINILKAFVARATEPWDDVGYAKHGDQDDEKSVTWGKNEYATRRKDLFKLIKSFAMPNGRVPKVAICKYIQNTDAWDIALFKQPDIGVMFMERKDCGFRLIWRPSRLNIVEVKP